MCHVLEARGQPGCTDIVHCATDGPEFQCACDRVVRDAAGDVSGSE